MCTPQALIFINLPVIDHTWELILSCIGACLRYPTFPGSHVKFARLFSDGGVGTTEAASTSGFILHEHLGVLNALRLCGSVRMWRRAAEVVLR